jgi:hypothetical protein
MDNMDTVARRLEPIMTSLAKAVLTSRPMDIDVFCHAFFARRLRSGEGQRNVAAARNSQSSSHQVVTDLSADRGDDEFEDDYRRSLVNLKLHNYPTGTPNHGLADGTEESADRGEQLQSDEGDVDSLRSKDGDFRPDMDLSYIPCGGPGGLEATTSFGDDGLTDMEHVLLRKAPSNFSQPDLEEETAHESLIRSMQWKEGEIQTNLPPGTILSPEEEGKLKEKMDIAMNDPRLQTLFEVWDSDRNGNVDLMELVVGLHKFEKVTSEGSELKKASDALAGAGDAQKAELNVTEFAKLIVQLSEDLYGQPFKAVADHLIHVARCSSERVALAASRGFDGSGVSRMIQEDEDDVQLLRETVKGMEESVVNSVRKIKTVRKVMFK